ncbi:uncharacterized protein LOC114526816 isoform X2 [Dendronephthya gigantea]|uniref:uncharacterized protein LOC114526816 isoform X2 n=1 Tax=Dendronephthya gigantea TaxID=151771 RepID=UPI00106C63C6|nr:uncharacterized protein LOC114526816 isoform X2 [Dendronephthya gigantea]
MGLRGLNFYILALAFTSLPFCIFSYKLQQDGSVATPKRCDCTSVELWLPKTVNEASNVFSYEESELKTLNDANSLSINTLYRGVRLVQFPKNCELILKENAAFYKQNIDDRSVVIWFKRKPLPICIAATVKCKLRNSCIGIHTRPEDEGHSTQRKLLMFQSDSNEKDTLLDQKDSVVLSFLAFCVVVVCIALCGKTEKNSQESVARDSNSANVEIISSEKVETIRRENPDHQETKVESVEIKVESPVPATDSNSNHSSPPVGEVNSSGSGETGVDGAVLGKIKSGDVKVETGDKGINVDNDELRGKDGDNLEQKGNDVGDASVQEAKKDKRSDSKKKEEKRKEKDRQKDMRSKRSHTAPTERVEEKPSKHKTRFSLKKTTDDSNAYDEPKMSKKDKKRSKKKSDNDQPLPSPPLPNTALPSPPVQNTALPSPPRPHTTALTRGDRRSFTNRELPKRPSDLDEDDYEIVQVKKGPKKDETKSSENDTNLYDSVDDREVFNAQAKGDPTANDNQSDAYESVDPKLKSIKSPALSVPNQEDYEDLYDEPVMDRQRSFSEGLPGSSSPRSDAERKTMSLGRQTRQDAAPTPPPVETIGQAKVSNIVVMDDIEPYTITVKKGDHIIQETNISKFAKPSGTHHVQPALSDDEKERLYTKVDKEKQKRDRAEAGDDGLANGAIQVEGSANENPYTKVDREKQTRDRIESAKGATNGEVEGEAKTNSDAKMDETAGVVQINCGNGEAKETVSSLAVDSVEEHQYESMPRQKKSGQVSDKNDWTFEETEDFQPYDEVDDRSNTKQRPGVYV